MSNIIGNLGTIPTFTVGGAVFTDLTNIIITYGHVVTSGHYTTVRRQNGSAGYLPSGSKTYKISAFDVATGQVASSEIQLFLLYGDTDVGLDSASAPTTPKYPGNDPACKSGVLWNGAGGTPNIYLKTFCTDFTTPNTKFTSVKADGAGITFALYGYEV